MNIFRIAISKTDIYLLTICGALIAIWIKHRLNLGIRRKNAIEANVKEFIAVFSEFILILQTKGALFPDTKMKEFIKQHEMAAINLRMLLDWWERMKFNRYWNQYKKKTYKYYNAPAQLGFPKTNKEMRNAITKLIKKIKWL